MATPPSTIIDDEDLKEDIECRVCRSEAEEGRRLYSPCKCSGSIQWTHQDCLVQWLDHSGKKVCELCKHQFEFSPLYAAGAPTRLPLREFLYASAQMTITKYLPFASKASLTIVCWLCLAPWATAWCYRLWFAQPTMILKNGIYARLHPEAIISDIRSGILIIVTVLFTFLALMSFADFLRVRVRVEQPEQPRDAARPLVPDENIQPHRAQENDNFEDGTLMGQDVARGDVSFHETNPVVEEAEFGPLIEEDSENEEGLDAAAAPRRHGRPNRAAGIRQANLDDGDQVELNFAMDELLGFTGPVFNVLRNVTWLVAFSLAYIGVFGYLPAFLVHFSIPQTWYLQFKSVLVVALNMFAADFMSSWSTAREIYSKSPYNASALGSAIRSEEVVTIFVGYVLLSLSVLATRFVLSIIYRQGPEDQVRNDGNGIIANLTNIVKVSSMLFIKMLALPIILGVFVDITTLSAISGTLVGRLVFAMEHTLGSLLIHWVIGITFMLFITVSVLQLREVLHPEILAPIIRPQETHPDLLQALLDESYLAHARRMSMSLVIYGILLLLLVSFPLKILSILDYSIGTGLFPLNLKFYYLVAEIQIPAELAVFHMFALSVLESYRDVMGSIQHQFMSWLCKHLGVTSFVLPRWKPLKNLKAALEKQDSVDAERLRILNEHEIVVHPPSLCLHPPTDAQLHEGRNKARACRNRVRQRYRELVEQGNKEVRSNIEVLNSLDKLAVNIRSTPWPETPEEQFQVKLCQRERPDNNLVRISALVLIVWSCAAAVSMTILLGPYFSGRLFYSLFTKYWNIVPCHDPYAVALIYLCLSKARLVCGIFVHLFNHAHSCTIQLLRIKCYFVWFFVIPLSLGTLMDACFVLDATQISNPLSLVQGISWTADFLIGCLSFHLWVFAVAYSEVKLVKDFSREVDAEDGPAQPIVDVSQVIEGVSNEAESDGIVSEVRKCCLQSLFFRSTPAHQLAGSYSYRGFFDFGRFESEVIDLVFTELAIVASHYVVVWIAALALSFSPAIFCWSFRLGVLFRCLFLIAQLLRPTLGNWMKKIHDKIRNDKYLIGKQLHDMKRE